jgi:hypothetical protein
MMLTDLQIPKKIRKKIDKVIQPGEFIKWADQPIPHYFTTDSIIKFSFGIVWNSLIVFMNLQSMSLGGLDTGSKKIAMFCMISIFLAPFYLIGFIMISSPLRVWRTARKTVYIVTDKRAIIIQCGWRSKIISYLPDQLKDTYRKERADGTGDVVIETRQWTDSDGDQNVRK